MRAPKHIRYKGQIYKRAQPSVQQGLVLDIEAETVRNRDYRRVLYTGAHSQLVLMSLPPGGEIGMETHPVDQFFRFEAGQGVVEINGRKSAVQAATAVVIPAGAQHNVRNTGRDRLQLYTIYSPPHHQDKVVVPTKADEAEEHFDGTTTEASTKE